MEQNSCMKKGGEKRKEKTKQNQLFIISVLFPHIWELWYQNNWAKLSKGWAKWQSQIYSRKQFFWKETTRKKKHFKPESENSKPSSLKHFCKTVIFCKEKKLLRNSGPKI